MTVILQTFLLILVPLALANPVPNKNPDSGLNVFQLVEKYGYPLEAHDVTTEDGYILQMHRIPHGRSNANGTGKPPILIMHGLTSSSVDWVNSAEKSLGFILADEGYDVWLGNARGNFWSTKHITLDPKTNEKEFWDFSWHEIGKFDLPAKIDHILETTKESKLYYAGHSQGTTSFFVMLSERPEYNAKIRIMNALGAVAYLKNAKNAIFKVIAENLNSVEWLFNNLGHHQFLPAGAINSLGQAICKEESPLVELCANFLFWICGPNPPQLDRSRISVYLTNIPSGAASKQVIHYAQSRKSGTFSQFDYGAKKNMEVYQQITPPRYDLSNSTAPIVLHYSANDYLSDAGDVEQFYGEIGSGVLLHKMEDTLFNHLDYLWGIDVVETLYKPMIALMKDY